LELASLYQLLDFAEFVTHDTNQPAITTVLDMFLARRRRATRTLRKDSG
jgi:hypothetical protein